MTTETLPAVRPVPAEPTTPIRPSEAIRLGCLIRPVQAFGVVFDGDQGTCALGALISIAAPDIEIAAIPAYRTLYNHRLTCPECPGDTAAGGSMVIHLNDDHRWSRERIADWLAEQGL